MKQAFASLAISAIIMCCGAAQAQEVPKEIDWLSGDAFLARCGDVGGAFCIGYVTGLMDEAVNVRTIYQVLGEKVPTLWCIPRGVTSNDTTQAVIKYLVAHPDQRALAAASTAEVALKAAYPCSVLRLQSAR